MRALIAAALFALTAGSASAATIDLAARDLMQGAALTEDQRMSVDVTDAFGFLMAQAITVSDNPRASIDLLAMGGMPVAGDLTLNFAPRLTGDSSVPALSATGLEMALDATGLAVLFSVVTPSSAVPGIGEGSMLYAVLSGQFGPYTGGDWTGEGQFSLYEVAPIPLPAGAVLLISGLGAMAAMRRRKRG